MEGGVEAVRAPAAELDDGPPVSRVQDARGLARDAGWNVIVATSAVSTSCDSGAAP